MHTLTNVYRSCTDVARELHVLFCVVCSLLHSRDMIMYLTSRNLLTQCHSLPLLVTRAGWMHPQR